MTRDDLKAEAEKIWPVPVKVFVDMEQSFGFRPSVALESFIGGEPWRVGAKVFPNFRGITEEAVIEDAAPVLLEQLREMLPEALSVISGEA